MYYWVNQGKTYKEEKEGGYLWAPTSNSSGKSFFHWNNMIKLKPNDIVFNFRKGFLVGYCIILSEYFLFAQPDEFDVDVQWEDEGYMIDAKYHLFNKPLDINQVYEKIKQYLPPKYSPLNFTGNPPKAKANQGYLYALDPYSAKAIFKLGNIYIENQKEIKHNINEEKFNYKLSKITTRKGLITLRTVQGEFRQQILKRWGNKCAVTNASLKEVLIASHIVPWREANDKERQDADNGILLSPVYDALFDRYLISFDDDGKIVLSNSFDNIEFLKLGITGNERIKSLSLGNKKYLKRHRRKLIDL
ncbi:HNH endonuclease signature motif containing protein [uncultured Psychroserpens sp.]|uniref:HNH endonuclease n=1 Tax=uncultured Psychroserpens sp. TaxID=255436 RepID=UPI0026173B04|nr:HNH endonuclease signature motif containing protein [uncultured Psychroserpens sp.]